MGASHLSGPLTSTAGFVGAVTGNLTGNVESSSLNIGAGGAIVYILKPTVVSVNIASMAAGVMSETSVTVTGAALGDQVLVTPPADLDASLMVAGAFVSATNTVKLRVRNNHATDPVDPAAQNWIFALIRSS